MIKYYTTPVLYTIRYEFGNESLSFQEGIYMIRIIDDFITGFLFTKNARLNGAWPATINPRRWGCYSWRMGEADSSPLSYAGIGRTIEAFPLSPCDNRATRIRDEFGIPKYICAEE